MPFAATWMDLEIIILSEVSQMEKDKYHMMSHMWNLRNINEIYETNIDSQRKQLYDYQRGREGGIN